MQPKGQQWGASQAGGLCCIMAAEKVSVIFFSKEGSKSLSLNSSPNIVI